MTVQLSALRVSADLDASGYVQGASQVTRADQEMIAGARQVSVALTDQQGKVSAAGDPIARLSRQFIDGYGSAQRLESGLRSVNRALETNKIDSAQAGAIYSGMAQKLGLVANAADITAQGYGRLGAVVDTVNAKLAQQSKLATTASSAMGGIHDSGASFRRQNLGYQLMDVGQMAMLGQNPAMLAMQQGPQIAQLYAGQGGMNAFLKETASMMGSVIRVAGPWVAALAAGYGAYKLLASFSQEARLQVDATTAALAAQAAPIGTVRSMIGELIQMQGTYSQAVSDHAATQSQASSIIVAETEREFNAKKALLQIEYERQQAAVKGKEAELATAKLSLEQTLRAIPTDGDYEYMAKLAGLDEAVAPIKQSIKELEAQLDLTKIGAEGLGRALNQSFAGGVAGGGSAQIAKLANMDFSQAISGANGFAGALGGIGHQARVAGQGIASIGAVTRDVTGGLSSIEAGLSRLGHAAGLQDARRELRGVQGELAGLQSQTAAGIFGPNFAAATQVQQSAMEQARVAIMTVADAVALGSTTWQTLDQSVEMARQQLIALGVDANSVNTYIDNVLRAALQTEDLEARVKQLGLSIQNLPDKTINIKINETTSRTTYGNGVNVYRSNGGSDAGNSSPSASLAADSEWDRGYDKFRDAQMDYDRANPFGPSAKLMLDVSGRDVTGIGAGYYATGGLIRGPGTGTSDSILSRLSNGEYVIRASSVSKYGTEMFDQLNRGALPAYADGGSVGGGSVPILGIGTLSEIEINTALTVDQIERLIGITDTMSGDILAMLRRSQASASASLGSRATGAGGAATGGVGGGIWMEPSVKAINTGYGAFVPGKTGYASGGIIPPSGSGSADTRYMEFMARPDETISIHTPAQRKAVVDALDRASEGGGTSISFGDIIIQLPAGADARQGQQAGRAAADEFKRRVRGVMGSRLHG